MNVWTFTGYLGRDAEQRFTASGDSIVNFSVAVDSGFGDKKQTTWPRCALFGKRGTALVSHLAKGTLVAISGEPSLREWEDKDGASRVSFEVRVSELTLLGGKDRSASQKNDADPLGGDDIPF